MWWQRLATVAVESSGETGFQLSLYRGFSVMVAAECGGALFGFVSGDKGDLLTLASCPLVAMIGGTDSEKVAACFCHATLVTLFRVDSR